MLENIDMELSLSHLSLLIELTEVELADMKKIIENPDSSSKEADDSSEHSMQLLSISSVLQTMYKNKWSSLNDELSYSALIDDIYQRRL